MEVSIYDVYGRSISTEYYSNTNKIEINTDIYSKGMYFVNLTVDGKKYSEKIIVK